MYEKLLKRLRTCATGDPICDTCDLNEDDCCYDTLMKQAADAIESLDDIAQTYAETVQELKMKSQWIPVTKKLPEEGKFVLVCGDLYPNKHDGGVIAVSKRIDWNYWQGFGRERNINHWMPLPEPPKEET